MVISSYDMLCFWGLTYNVFPQFNNSNTKNSADLFKDHPLQGELKQFKTIPFVIFMG